MNNKLDKVPLNLHEASSLRASRRQGFARSAPAGAALDRDWRSGGPVIRQSLTRLPWNRAIHNCCHLT